MEISFTTWGGYDQQTDTNDDDDEYGIYCYLLVYFSDGACDDFNNYEECHFDGGDCCRGK